VIIMTNQTYIFQCHKCNKIIKETGKTVFMLSVFTAQVEDHFKVHGETPIMTSSDPLVNFSRSIVSNLD